MVGEEGVRLFDFGLGHAQAEAAVGLPSVSRSRFNAWTPAYAAPELLAGGALTAAADLYGVACILYELAHGRRVGKRASTDRLPRPAQLPRHCWAALQAALAIDPQHRSITVAELRHVMGRNRARWCL